MASTHVLIVDDDQDSADILALVLERQVTGTLVRVFYDAASALVALERACPDVIISDLNMAEMNGHEFALAARSICAACRPSLIALSGEVDHLMRAISEPVFDRVFCKPVDVTEIVEILENSQR